MDFLTNPIFKICLSSRLFWLVCLTGFPASCCLSSCLCYWCMLKRLLPTLLSPNPLLFKSHLATWIPYSVLLCLTASSCFFKAWYNVFTRRKWIAQSTLEKSLSKSDYNSFIVSYAHCFFLALRRIYKLLCLHALY